MTRTESKSSISVTSKAVTLNASAYVAITVGEACEIVVAAKASLKLGIVIDASPLRGTFNAGAHCKIGYAKQIAYIGKTQKEKYVKIGKIEALTKLYTDSVDSLGRLVENAGEQGAVNTEQDQVSGHEDAMVETEEAIAGTHTEVVDNVTANTGQLTLNSIQLDVILQNFKRNAETVKSTISELEESIRKSKNLTSMETYIGNLVKVKTKLQASTEVSV